MRLTAIILAALALGACTSGGADPEMAGDDGGIVFERNSEFQGPRLRVFLNLRDGRPVSANTEDDAVETESRESPIPGHEARNWSFVKEEPEGTSIVYAVASWDGDDPADYLMAGWWAYFDGERPPELTFANLEEHALLDGPELDPAAPPELPAAGTASYVGPAGGVYFQVPGATAGECLFVLDGWEATVSLTADFGAGTVAGCVGCIGDFVTRPAVVRASRGDVAADISGYELHFAPQSYGADGTFDGGSAEIRHPSRRIVESGGSWGGSFSNKADADGNPRLIAGFGGARYEEDDGAVGSFFGSFVGMTARFRNSGPGSSR